MSVVQSDETTDGPSKKVRPEYRPVSQDVTAYLRQAILEGRLAPGERIGQESIAGEFQVSRIPVREALRQLATEGLVTQVPHSGARVSRHDPAQMLELYLLRESLEPLLIEHSVANLTDEQIEALERQMSRVISAENDVRSWLLEDRIFHLSSFQAAGLPTALKLAEQFYNQTQPHRREFFNTLSADDDEIVHLEHRLIFDAVRRRAPDEAAELHRMHIRRTRRRLAANNALNDLG